MPTKDPVKIRAKSARSRLRGRTGMLELFGNKCRECGFTDRRALQLDHITGTENGIRWGNRSKRKTPDQICRMVINGTLKKSDFQLLCANCHCIKTANNKDYLNHLKHPYAYKQLPLPILKRMPVWMVCRYCKEPYLVAASVYEKSKYCSNDCKCHYYAKIEQAWRISTIPGQYTKKGDRPKEYHVDAMGKGVGSGYEYLPNLWEEVRQKEKDAVGMQES